MYDRPIQETPYQVPYPDSMIIDARAEIEEIDVSLINILSNGYAPLSREAIVGMCCNCIASTMDVRIKYMNDYLNSELINNDPVFKSALITRASILTGKIYTTIKSFGLFGHDGANVYCFGMITAGNDIVVVLKPEYAHLAQQQTDTIGSTGHFLPATGGVLPF